MTPEELPVMTPEEDAMTRTGTPGRSPLSAEGGSIAMAMLAAIAVAGLIVVIAGATLAGQQATRFDQSFSEDIHGADAGVQDALYRLNAGYFDPDTPVDTFVGPTYPADDPATAEQERVVRTIDDTTYAWYAERTGEREWRIESTATLDGVERTVVAEIEERARFAPGAFSDSTLALSGTSSRVDSYTSDACAAGTDPVVPDSTCHWYPDTDGFGTGNGVIGSNEVVEVSGNTKAKHIMLYDWDDNPGVGATQTDPGGDRCNGESAGSPCIAPGVVRTVGYELDYASDTAFITDKLDNCGPLQKKTLKAGDLDVEQDFYCYEGVAFRGDFPLPAWASATNPVVIYVRDYVSVLGPNARVNCAGCDKNKPHLSEPVAGALQIYVAGGLATGGGNVGIKSQSGFGGVIYAPESRCGSDSGGAGVHVYGSMTCRLMDNVGNWEFHFDEALSQYGTGVYNVAYWTEE